MIEILFTALSIGTRTNLLCSSAKYSTTDGSFKTGLTLDGTILALNEVILVRTTSNILPLQGLKDVDRNLRRAQILSINSSNPITTDSLFQIQKSWLTIVRTLAQKTSKFTVLHKSKISSHYVFAFEYDQHTPTFGALCHILHMVCQQQHHSTIRSLHLMSLNAHGGTRSKETSL